MLPSDYFALQAWRTKYTILEAGVKWSQSNDVCLLVTKILVAGLRRCVGCLLVGWFSESRIRNWQKTWLAMFTLAVFDESLKKNEMWEQIIRKLREKKLSECENWGKLGWEWIGKSTRRVVYAGGVMAKPTSAVYPKNTHIQIHQ